MNTDLTWDEYSEYVELVLNAEIPPEPYNDADFYKYAKLNRERGKRWLKTFQPLPEVQSTFAAIEKPQKWLLITEPWCGDAAHVNPVVYLLSRLNENISLCVQLRDSGSAIENYLTNGTRSIPKLIIRDEAGNDLGVWGPRPVAAMNLFNDLRVKGAGKEEMILALQNWYNKDKTIGVQTEIAAIVQQIVDANQ